MNTPMDAHTGLTAVDYDPFASPALERVVPSTEAQREIWLAAKLVARLSQCAACGARDCEASLTFSQTLKGKKILVFW